MNPRFWNGRRVLVTGHTGFKGTWLALWLERLGARVTGLALAPVGERSLFADAGVETGMTSLTGDVRDPATVREAVDAARPEIVFHLSAQALVHESYRDPLGTWATNVQGTAHLLEACRGRDGLAAVVVVTSDKCYENLGAERAFREDDPLGGHDPYSASKAAAEMVTASYRRSFFGDGSPTAVASARSGNVIGGGDWAADRLVPDLVRGFAAGRPVPIRRPGAVRPWQHVLEPLSGYLVLAERLVASGAEVAEAWNFGPADADARPVSWVADRLVELWGGGAGWERDPAEHPPEAAFLRLDCAKAAARLAWRPRLALETALAWTVDGYRATLEDGDPRAHCERQIADYEALAPAAARG